jgi:hypothetical protein
MAKTKRTPGPKPGATKKHGDRRDFHILLSDEAQKGEAMSLAEAFVEVASSNDGIIAYAAKIIRERPEIIEKLKGQHKQ